MKKIINIAVVGLGQVGIYLLNELNSKKKTLKLKLARKLKLLLSQLGILIKKDSLKLIKKYSIKIL